MMPWWKDYSPDEGNILINEDFATLTQRAIHYHEGHLSADGAFVLPLNSISEVSPSNRYVVRDDQTKDLDWTKLHALTQRQFDNIKNEFVRKFNHETKTVYLMERSAGPDPRFSLGLRFVTPQASQALMIRNLYKESLPNHTLGELTVLLYPNLELASEGLGLSSTSVIAINLATLEIIIGGLSDSAEIKGAIFKVLGYLLQESGIFAVQASANKHQTGKVSVFLGDQEAGKTTLALEDESVLLSDDGIGLSHEGVFNLETGCCVRTTNLIEMASSQVLNAVKRFGTVYENVLLDDEHNPNFRGTNFSSNGMAIFPLNFISSFNPNSIVPFPHHIFFLHADTSGVLPVLAKLGLKEAIYFFLLSNPVSLTRTTEYVDRLSKLLSTSDNLWLINTGWPGPPNENSKRYSLPLTRQLIREVQNGIPEKIKYWAEPAMGLRVPEKVSNIRMSVLDPKTFWSINADYEEAIREFKKNMRVGINESEINLGL